MATTPPTTPIPETIAFKKSTTFSKFKKGRNTIGLIDLALDAYHDATRSGDTRSKYRASVALVKACNDWLTAKSGGTSKNRALRQAAVTSLGNTAFEWLKYWQFESAKKDRGIFQSIGRHVAPTQGLRPGYSNEYFDYHAANKTHNPLSGTWAHQQHEGFHKEMLKQIEGTSTEAALPFNVQAVANKSFATLSTNDFHTLQTHMGGDPNLARVWYMSKTDRRNFMLIVQNGIFHKGFNDPLPLNTFYMYAMDKYGSMFAARTNASDPNGATYLNHSTFNAGNDIICAGEIKSVLGRPTIDNASGHYQPSVDQLHEALTILNDAGLRIRDWQVGIHSANGTHVYSAALFLANKHNPGPRITTV